MIYELYSFSPGTFVVADEWNANFRTLYKTAIAHQEALVDAQSLIAFPNSDLTYVFNAVHARKDSEYVFTNSVSILAGREYYKTLDLNEVLNIIIPDSGISGDARILIKTQEQRDSLPFTISFLGETKIHYGFYGYNYFRAGYYYIMIYEQNGLAQVKLVWTGA